MKLTCTRLAASSGFVALLCLPSTTWAQSAPTLTDLASFAVLGGSAVTASGPAGTVVSGNVGSNPTATVNGFGPAVVTAGFTVYRAADPATAAARSRASSAYGQLSQSCPAANNFGAGVVALGTRNLVPGVYCMGSAGLTGTLTLTGGAADVWVIQTSTTLTTAGASQVVMAGTANACNVYWQIGSSATLGASSTLRGNIFANVSIGMGTTATVIGRLIAGSGAVTMDGTDTVGGCSAAASCPVITVNPATLPGATAGVAYSRTITASGGTAPYTFSVTTGTLPAGLTLTSGGLLSGTPTTAGTSTFTIRGTDSAGCFGERAYTIVIAAVGSCPVITVSPSAVPGGTISASYSQTTTASGGTAPYTFARSAGSLPGGLTLSAAGALNGTPTTAGTFSFTVRGSDAAGCIGDRVYTIAITSAEACPPITLSPTSLHSIQVGADDASFAVITGSGGTSPYSFTVTAGTLPTGLVLENGGRLGGKPTTPGLSNFTVRGTDSAGCFGERPYALAITAGGSVCPPISISPATLTNATQGVAYSKTIAGHGGAAPYTFAVTAGAVPEGLTLSTAGALSGTPTVPGPYEFTVVGTDTNGCLQAIAYTFTVISAVPTLPEWAMIILMMLLGVAGFAAVRRRARAE